jgi:site-specific DNA recombinase
MQGSRNDQQAYCRCTFPTEYARTNHIQPPGAVYLREAEIAPPLDAWLAKAFDPAHLPATIADLTSAQPDYEPAPEIAALRTQIADFSKQLASYRATLDAGADPAVVSQWITETQVKKLAAEGRLHALAGRAPTGQPPG